MTWSIIRATVLVIRVSFAWLLTNSVEEAGGTVQYSMLDDILVQQQEEMGGTYSPFSFQVIDSQRWLLFCLMLVVLNFLLCKEDWFFCKRCFARILGQLLHIWIRTQLVFSSSQLPAWCLCWQIQTPVCL